MLSILNNISSLNAQNSMSTTQAKLQQTLVQLSTGMRINSGSDDAAGLSIANGLQANISALTQSVQNASNGVGMLQTADGALSQVTGLLNRAVTLATEAANAGLTTGAGATQASALDNEYQSILTEIGQIGTSTNFNGTAVFGTNGSGAGNQNIALSDGTLGGVGASINVNAGALTTAGLGLKVQAGTISLVGKPANNDTVTVNSVAYTFVSSLSASGATANEVLIGSDANATLGNLAAALTGGAGAATTYGTGSTSIAATQTATVSGNTLTITPKANQTAMTIAAGTDANGANETVVTASGSNSDLTTTANAKLALQSLTAAINQVSGQRGTIGASINQLNAASAVMTNEVQNLTSAQNSIQNADIGKTVANMTQYNVLQSTGMSALQQSNQAQQAVLKLLQ